MKKSTVVKPAKTRYNWSLYYLVSFENLLRSEFKYHALEGTERNLKITSGSIYCECV